MTTHGFIAGPINMCAPENLTNKTFSVTLADQLNRIAMVVQLPGAMAKLLMGDLAKETVLGNINASPNVLLESGYRFRYPRLENALAHIAQ